MDLITIVLIVTPIVLGVILLVIGVIFFTVVIPPTRQKLAEKLAERRKAEAHVNEETGREKPAG